MHCQIWLKQSTVTHPAVCHDEVVIQQFASCSGSPDDDNYFTSVLPVEVFVIRIRSFDWRKLCLTT